MTRRIHRLLLLAALTLAVGVGVWLGAAAATSFDASSAGDVNLAALTHGTHGALVTARLRISTPCAVAAASQRLRAVPASAARPLALAAPHRNSIQLHALLRVYRI